MSEISKFEALKKKMQGVCDENSLVFRFRNNQYPLTLTIRPLNGVQEQLSLLADAEDNGYTSPDAYIVFAYKDGNLTYKTSETFTISDALFSKIKNLYKSMHAMWLQYFYRHTIERNLLSAQCLPRVADEDCDSNENESLFEGDEREGDGDTEEKNGDSSCEGERFDEEAEDGREFLRSGCTQEDADEFTSEAARLVRESGTATVAFLQRSLKIGYARAARIMDELERLGVVGTFNGAQSREIYPESGT